MGMPIRRFPSDDGAPQPKRRRSSLLSSSSSQSPSPSPSPSPAPDSDATDSVGDFTVMEMASRIISAQVNAANNGSNNNASANRTGNTESLLPSLLSSPARVPNARRVFVLPRGRRATIADAFAGIGDRTGDNENENNNNNDNSNGNSNSIIDISDSDDVTTDTEVLQRFQRRLRPRRRRWPRASILPHDLARNNTNINSFRNDSDDSLNSRQRSIAISMSRANGLDLSAVSQVSVFYSGRISHSAPGSPSLKGSLHLCKTRRHVSNASISALSVVFTDIEPVSVDIPNWWLIGTWPINDGNVSAQTVFQLLMDVLHESGSIPSVVIADLLVCDDLHTVPGVQQAISMLKRGGDRSSGDGNVMGNMHPLIASSPAARRLTQRLRLRQRYSSEALDSAAVLAQLNNAAGRAAQSNGPLWPERWSHMRSHLSHLSDGRQDVDGDDNSAPDGLQSVEGSFLHPVTGDSVSVCVE